MPISIEHPTPYPEVNRLLGEVLAGIQPILGEHLIGMYLDGSLACDTFDQASDIDFVVVTDQDIAGGLFLALQALHDQINSLDSIWAIQLEGSYISRHAIRRYDPEHSLHPNIERGLGEHLKLVVHDETWAVHRHILRQRGITLLGPSPQSLIDPVSPSELRQAMLKLLNGWATHILNHPQVIDFRGYQSYVVLTLCRALYTLQSGEVATKPAAVRWARATLGERWIALIERAWENRHNPDPQAQPEDIQGTLNLIQYAIERSRKLE